MNGDKYLSTTTFVLSIHTAGGLTASAKQAYIAEETVTGKWVISNWEDGNYRYAAVTGEERPRGSDF